LITNSLSSAISFIVVGITSYFLGSIPTGYLVGRLAGIDIRSAGSGNIGATNVTRILGKKYGYPVFLVDFLKGFAAVTLSDLIAKYFVAGTSSLQVFELVAAVCSVLGHSFPIWLRFRGGKGVATSAGALFGLMPLAALIVAVVWVLTFQLTRYVSVASMTAAIALPIAVATIMHFQGTSEWTFFYFSACMAAVIVLRHRSNLSRLMRGTEPRFTKSED
jgi:glycerol-3-phosphate acyltransferase PlsY